MSEQQGAGKSDTPDFDTLSSTWIGTREDSDTSADNTDDGYKYAIQRFKEFLDDFDLEYTDIDKGSDLEVELRTVSDKIDPEYDSKTLLNYFVDWLQDEAGAQNGDDPERWGYADSTTRTTWYSLRPFLAYLIEEGHLERDALKDEDVVLSDYLSYDSTLQDDSTERLKEKAVKPEEHELLLENAGSAKFRNQLLLNLFWETGMRREEMAKLTKDDVLRGQSETEIRVPPTKWPRKKKKPDGRKVWVSKRLRTNLNIWVDVKREECPGHDEYDELFLQVHPPNEGPLTPDRLNEIVKNCAERAGLDEVLFVDKAGNEHQRLTCHSYRHAFAFESLAGESREGGMDIWAVAQMMGHSAVEVTERYLEPQDEYLENQRNLHGPKSP